MGVTYFPDGISAGGVRTVIGTLVTVAPFSTGTVATGLGTVLFGVGNLSVAGTGASHCTAGTSPGGGTLIFNVYGTAAAAASVAGTIYYVAVGS